jgi:hypothetical protein
MSINEHWNRWILASVGKHFDTETGDLHLYMSEGQHRRTEEEEDFIELRLDGPHFAEVSKGAWNVDLAVNILVSTVMDDVNWQGHVTNVGVVQSAFTTIEVYKFGTITGVDDQTLLGCLKVVNDAGREPLVTRNFGQLGPAVKVQQSTVEGHFELDLSV